MVVCFFKGKGIQYKSFKEDCFLGLNNKPKRTYAFSFPYPLTLLTPVTYVSPARYLTESFQEQTLVSHKVVRFSFPYCLSYPTFKTLLSSRTSRSFQGVPLLMLKSKLNSPLSLHKKGTRCEHLCSYQSVAMPVHASFGS